MAGSDVVKAAGFVIFRRQPVLEYLLMQASYGIHHWTPPKGHVEKGEDLLQTAYRETEEEAGISKNDLLLTNYSETINYEVNNKPKAVTYYLAQLADDASVKLSHEHQDFKWANLEDACVLVNFPEMQKVLRNCDAFLQSDK
ncbi:bis(5'-nucleosyl)-tetraphosphatase [asymmetrical] [Halyomorpha halys]|uniref:bis(5'-nucleosyl)-tetraphosphatase [asymmetrical] n=1 Tax=Halyomorpha halys TaxID=286706 RepID=UPI0006D51468|nr:bis(5'-nucleosyl)-tetraphosphatase [asymmetrical] [Halyomorpha halys]